MTIHDVVVDTLFEENVEATLKVLGAGRIVRDKDDPEEPFLLGEEGYLIVRVRDRDPHSFARELERRTDQMRIVEVIDRTPIKETR